MPRESSKVDLPDLNSGVDDCFASTGCSVSVMVDQERLEVTSDCSHRVVYTDDPEGSCVEPQSGPPNAIELGSFVLEAGHNSNV